MRGGGLLAQTLLKYRLTHDRLISPFVEQVAVQEVGEIDINICRYSCTLRSSLLVRLKPYISPDVAIDCPPSILFLSIYMRLNSFVLYYFMRCYEGRGGTLLCPRAHHRRTRDNTDSFCNLIGRDP